MLSVPMDCLSTPAGAALQVPTPRHVPDNKSFSHGGRKGGCGMLSRLLPGISEKRRGCDSGLRGQKIAPNSAGEAMPATARGLYTQGYARYCRRPLHPPHTGGRAEATHRPVRNTRVKRHSRVINFAISRFFSTHLRSVMGWCMHGVCVGVGR